MFGVGETETWRDGEVEALSDRSKSPKLVVSRPPLGFPPMLITPLRPPSARALTFKVVMTST